MSRDYLSQFLHSKADGGSGISPQALDAKINRIMTAFDRELADAFGPDVNSWNVVVWLRGLPKKKQDEARPIFNSLDRKYKEKLDALRHADEAPEYLAARMDEPIDVLWHGVKGMKWGRRRTPAQLASAAKSRGDSEADSSKKDDGPETAQVRYTRLKAQAKDKGANSLSEEDLKFFNARTEAVAKINKMHQDNPGWLAETTKKIVQKTAQESLQNVASAVAQQYITKPVIKSLGAEPPKKKK